MRGRRSETFWLRVESLERRDLLAGLDHSAQELACLPWTDHATEPVGATALSGDVEHRAPTRQPVTAEPGAEPEPQYVIHQTPRLQPGNAPLYGTPSYRGSDQVDILWQTITVGDGTQDRFEVRYRRFDGTWQSVPLNAPIDTGANSRLVHSATLTGLDWNTRYDYVVAHYRGDELLVSYDAEFKTRLAPGDPTPFTFTAYGDSAAGTSGGFKQVQTRINELAPDFNVLLGDNFYEFGTHENADARFSAELNPPATEWIAEHIDYFAIGNHDALLNPAGGRPSRESYSVPIPIAGVNAFASPPANDAPEHNFSFDYGDVHFVTYDSNAAELQRNADQRATLEYVLADLKASTARWKIVYTHHPILGTAKFYDSPSGAYFQMALPLLREAGADLLLSGDSHTYSWTYPLTGFADDDQSGVVDPDEVDFVAGSTREFVKGSGLIQVVSGVGGKSLYFDDYPDPFMAARYSRHATAWPSEFGFSRIDVKSDRLVVSYISAATGKIVGDTNGNGIGDGDEPMFGQFELIDPNPLQGDLNQDGERTLADIDLMCAAVLAQDFRSEWDFNNDRQLTVDDYDWLTKNVLKFRTGDANGDRRVNSSDLVQVFSRGLYREDLAATQATWAEGDWTCDGQFDSTDLVRLFQRGYDDF